MPIEQSRRPVSTGTTCGPENALKSKLPRKSLRFVRGDLLATFPAWRQTGTGPFPVDTGEIPLA